MEVQDLLKEKDLLEENIKKTILEMLTQFNDKTSVGVKYVTIQLESVKELGSGKVIAIVDSVECELDL